ncbi:cellulose synthase complex periplasmic endoglucanase BcsZ [Herbaspirillum sp. NPDC087042]|uniref:cellulose synthase complex periplasmic endoglucanase BcsZ n=1 Tax=Herbaspirillum sp. NPDC087042 TaxID=3364004 RepID=UPI00380D138D
MTLESPKRRRLLQAGAALSLPALAALPAMAADPNTAACPHNWPQWEAFARRHLQADGRIIDYAVPQQQSTSESQSYGMFFALVANDRVRFERIWRWSRDNLGAAGEHLPAWQWGKRDDGSFGVLDPNAAADADLWFAYSLLEAARLWQLPAYAQAAQALLEQVKAQEVRNMGALGPMLLPGPQGFEESPQRWRLNPSYLPLPVLRRLAAADPGGPWDKMAPATLALVTQASPHGFTPDWLLYDTSQGVQPDTARSVLGSYDAIRVYLWAGLTDEADVLAAPLRKVLAPMLAATINGGAPPEKCNTVTGTTEGQGPVGFSAALLPMLAASRQDDALKMQQQSVQQRWDAWHQDEQDQPGGADVGEFNYYNSVLTLFGLGWVQGQYRFDGAGRLQPAWACSQ